MALLNRNRLLLAKIEGTYGQDSSPTGVNAILVRNLNPTPQDGESVGRDLIRPYLGNSPQLPGSIRGAVGFEVEMAGSGTAGTAPAYGPLLRACGLAEKILATPATGSATAGSATTITLAAGASAVDQFYQGMRIDITGGTGSGQYATIRDYVGATKVATFCETLPTPLAAASTYSIPAQVAYVPVSATFESVTMQYRVRDAGGQDVMHKLTGARGNVGTSLSAKGIPVLKFSFTGMYQPVVDTAAVIPTFTGFQQPLTSNTANTPNVQLHGVSPVLQSLDTDFANQIVHRALIGSEAVLLTDRKVGGQIVFEATLVATKDWWTIAKNATLGSFYLLHGTVAGNKVHLAAPYTQIVKPNYSDQDGIAMLSAGLTFNPGSSGNDEFFISTF
jgi:hypothetical protein